TTTGPEIWAQTGGRLDAIVCGVGSGGTLTGLSRYFANVAPGVEMVLADPKGSVLAGYVATGTVGIAGSWLVGGTGGGLGPPRCDLSRVTAAYVVDDAEAFATVRTLVAKAGILAGTSSGTLIAAAVRYCRDRAGRRSGPGGGPGKVVTIVVDSGAKY